MDEIFRDLPNSNPDERVTKQAIAMIIDQPIRISLRSRFGRRIGQGLKPVHREVRVFCPIGTIMPIEVVPLGRASSARTLPLGAKETRGARAPGDRLRRRLPNRGLTCGLLRAFARTLRPTRKSTHRRSDLQVAV